MKPRRKARPPSSKPEVVKGANPCPYCPSRKRAYRSRQEAKRAARALHPGDSALHPYACLDAPEHVPTWHLGHLDPRARAGEAGRQDLYPPRGFSRHPRLT